jgi:flagellar basal-body rod modification protein FlgD
MADSITGAASTTAAATINKATDRTTIAQNFDAFLLLLTTQLKNQSPLDPLDTNQFLNALLTSSRASTASTAASFVGMTVTADGATTRLAGGKAEWMINPARAAQATITIVDSKGSIVASDKLVLSAGTQRFTWTGRTSTGAQAPEGDYTINVSAQDATGQGVSVKTELSGKVDAVDMSAESPVLVIGASRVPLGNVRSISRPTTP